MFFMPDSNGLLPIARKSWRQRVKDFLDYWAPPPGTLFDSSELKGQENDEGVLRCSHLEPTRKMQSTALFCLQYADKSETCGTIQAYSLSTYSSTGEGAYEIEKLVVPNMGREMLKIILAAQRRGKNVSMRTLADYAGISKSEIYSIISPQSAKTRKMKVPAKTTLIRLARALRMTLEELKELLLCSGYALSPYLSFDRAVEEVFRERKYGYDDVNDIFRKWECEVDLWKERTRRSGKTK